MNDIEQTYQMILNLTPQQRLEFGQNALASLISEMSGINDDAAKGALLFAVLSIFTQADGRVSYDEYLYIQQLTGMNLDYSSMEDLIQQAYATELAQSIEVGLRGGKIKKKMAEGYLALAACVFSADGDFSPHEKAMLRSIALSAF